MFRCICATVLLTALVAAGGASGAKAAPLPEIKVVDTFHYTYMSGPFTDRAILSVARDGKVTYFYQSKAATDSGGVNVGNKWDISKKDAAALLDGLIEDGLLKVKDTEGKKSWAAHCVTVNSGSRKLTICAKELPEKVFARLLPLLQQAHPQMWKAKLPK